ncbi:hypothetical protein TB1_018577 [Malus domestica]
MARKRGRKPVKQVASSPGNDFNLADEKEPQIEKQEAQFTDLDVDRQISAIRAMRDVEIEHLLTKLRLLRSYFTKEQLQTPLLQFFKHNYQNLSIVTCGENGMMEVQWLEKDGNVSMNDGIDLYETLYKIRNEDIRGKVGVAEIEGKMRENRLRWFGHVQRRPTDAPIRRCDYGTEVQGRRGRGRPRKTLEETLRKDLRVLGSNGGHDTGPSTMAFKDSYSRSHSVTWIFQVSNREVFLTREIKGILPQLTCSTHKASTYKLQQKKIQKT